MKLLKILILSLAVFLPVIASPIAFADPFNPLEKSCDQNEASQSEICQSANSSEDPITGDDNIFVTIANILSLVAGAVAVVMIIVSGITMITSGGDSAKVKKSRDTIIYAAIGLVVVVASRTIVLFLIKSLT